MLFPSLFLALTLTFSLLSSTLSLPQSGWSGWGDWNPTPSYNTGWGGYSIEDFADPAPTPPLPPTSGVSKTPVTQTAPVLAGLHARRH